MNNLDKEELLTHRNDIGYIDVDVILKDENI